MPIRLQPAHAALTKLIDDLQKVGLAELNKLAVPKAGDTKTAAQWIAALEIAKAELEQWCPDGNSFVIDLEPQ